MNLLLRPAEELQQARAHHLLPGSANLEACFRLRYRYFVEERGWVKPDPELQGVERDGYDDHALHLCVQGNGEVAVYLRALPFQPDLGFMLDRELSCLLPEEQRRALPREGAVELSRLVVCPSVPMRGAMGYPHPVERLLKQLYHLSKERGFTRFYIVVELCWLAPFARRFGLPFQVIGRPHVFPDGTRTVAAWATLEELEAGMRAHSAAKYAWYQADG